jgi:nitroreductase
MKLLQKLGLAKKPFPPEDLRTLSNVQLLSLMRHEAHRIEKSVYNDIKERKAAVYRGKRDRVVEILAILKSRDVSLHEATVQWASEIVERYDRLEEDFILARRSEPRPFRPEAAAPFLDLVHSRRSCRVWAEEQPAEAELRALARQMIDSARWAPTSGNRQPWRFLVLTDPVDKQRLAGLKEQHCTSAPLLVFLGMDQSVYGFLGDDERSLYIDGGAAAMQMVLTAHAAGLGTCWNHFADDLIRSRPKNVTRYREFREAMGIPLQVAPVAIIAVGRPQYVPPVPARTDIDDLLLRPSPG